MKDKITIICFMSIISGFAGLSLIFKDREISFYERRKLTTKEDLKGDFLENLDDYLIDQFPLRDDLISLDTTYERYLLNNRGYNDAFIQNGSIIEKNYPQDKKSIQDFAEKLNYIKDTFLTSSNIFYAVIPDKSYFLEEGKYLKLDFQNMINELNSKIYIPYIDIFPLLVLDDYYNTDIHIKQPNYLKVAKKLDDSMDFGYYPLEYKENKFENFKGASYSKVPNFFKPDELVYLTNAIQDNLSVKHLEHDTDDIYNLEELEKVDPYNVFLKGPSSIIEIENDDSSLTKELVLFRDSFSSSLAPLLAPFYKKITLIDLRYISIDLASTYVDFENSDVLFIYSTLIINKSNLLKVSKD